MSLMMTERLHTMAALKHKQLQINLVCSFGLNELNQCCAQIEKAQLDPTLYQSYPAIQCAMLEQPGFFDRYQDLLDMGISAMFINDWLSIEHATDCHLMDYSAEDMAILASLSTPCLSALHEYAMYFHPTVQDPAAAEIICANLVHFYKTNQFTPSMLSEEERSLFTHDCMHRHLFAHEAKHTFPLLAQNPILLGYLDTLCARHIDYMFRLSELQKLQALTDVDVGWLLQIHDVLGGVSHAIYEFLRVWIDTGAHAEHLPVCASKLSKLSIQEQHEALQSRLSYLNMLYGGQLDGVCLRDIPGDALPLLSYALAKQQNAFLRLVREHMDDFLQLDDRSMLFHPGFFQHLHLNSLTHKHLLSCLNEPERIFPESLDMLGQQIYTFEEMRLLYTSESVYACLYSKLTIPRTDDRLIVLRQLRKRRLLPTACSQDKLATLACKLSEKPLNRWMEQELAHIQELQPRQAVLLLMEYEDVSRFLPDMTSATEVTFYLNNQQPLAAYDNWHTAMKKIRELDQDWHALQKELELDEAFIQENEQHIQHFLLNNGAHIARVYSPALGCDPEGFYRILRAQLMGGYHTLKYFADDLSIEIAHPITDEQKQTWVCNTEVQRAGFTVRETDDFFSIMQVGEIPQHTCLSYINGSHRDCLLSTFDSNKKILYASMDGKLAGRAMLRLTKGCEKANTNPKRRHLEFADLRSDQSAPRHQDCEEMVLFLERSYVSGIDERMENTVNRLFIALAEKKAAELGIRLVLSHHYVQSVSGMGYASMNYALYISQSKAGYQYLDSLGGQCSARNECSYTNNLFLLKADTQDVQ
ncbi:MAG: hypothetical protein IJX67_02425 [Oscillospiraceae bacterium]|nr:hypothetical protein [Oscillospiraceae bacterium]